MPNNSSGNLAKFQTRIQNLKNTSNDLQKTIWQRVFNATKQTTPAFVIGCGRSGTSMLVFHLERSWHLELYNEAHSSEAFDLWWLKDLDIIESLVKRSYAPVCLFKPILDTYRIHDLFARFPAARVLFAFRYYPDVINSAMKRFGKDDWYNRVRSWIYEDFSEYKAAPPPEETKEYIRSMWKDSLNFESGTALYWLFHNRLYFDLNLDKDKRVHLIHYESLVTNPKPEFERVCNFLQIPLEAKIVEGVHSTSISRDDLPEIEPEIRQECEKMWHTLTEAFETRSGQPTL